MFFLRKSGGLSARGHVFSNRVSMVFYQRNCGQVSKSGGLHARGHVFSNRVSMGFYQRNFGQVGFVMYFQIVCPWGFIKEILGRWARERV